MHTGHPKRNPEDSIIRDKFDTDFIPPPHRKAIDNSPLVQPVKTSQADSVLRAQAAATEMDCLKDLYGDIKWPLWIGVGYGCVLASVYSQPPADAANQKLYTSQLRLTARALMREAAFVRVPALFLGGFAAIYSLASCSVAKWRGEDGLINSAAGGMVTGAAMGLYLRDPNRMFMCSIYGAGIGTMIKHYMGSRYQTRPAALTYYELKEARKSVLSYELRQEAQRDGYLHRYLDPQLKALGVQVPDKF